MSADVTTSQSITEQKPNDKEFNFRQQEAKYEKKLAEERAAREKDRQAMIEMERELQRIKSSVTEEDEEEQEPYVDTKKLNKKLAKFGEVYEKNTDTKINQAVNVALQQERQKSWIENNPDFYDVLQSHAEKLALRSPKLAESILRMPDSFERQQLVYNNIKALGLDQPEPKQPSIQEKIDANRRTPYYQPSGIPNAPYSNGGDYSPSGQKNAYAKMQELKAKLKI